MKTVVVYILDMRKKVFVDVDRFYHGHEPVLLIVENSACANISLENGKLLSFRVVCGIVFVKFFFL